MKNIKERLEEIRNDSTWWKVPKISGQDQYAGMPPFLRVIDEILKEFETGKVLISMKEYDEMSKETAWLSCLEQAGVDNWEGYDCASDLWRENYPEYNKD